MKSLTPRTKLAMPGRSPSRTREIIVNATNRKLKITASFIIALILAFATAQAQAQDADLKVSVEEALKAATSRVQPVYPAIAKQLRLEGEVEVEAHITTDGSVESVRPVTGNVLLSEAAVAAAKNWKFAPFMSEGKAVKVVVSLIFKFKM
jgi:protein TonB